MKIEEMKKDDLKEVMEIFRGLKEEDYFYKRDVILAERDYKEWLENKDMKGTAYYVCRSDEGRILAALGYQQDRQAEGVYYLSHFVVKDEARGQGIGTKMLRFLEQKLKEKGARILIAWTSKCDYCKDTRHFYNNKGFTLEAVIPDYWKEGDDLAVYYKKLNK